MPLRDPAAMNASLDNDYGTTRGPHASSTHLMRLYVGDPMTDGIELDGTNDPGYSPATVLATAWLAATDGFKSTNPVQFAAPTGPWLHEPTHFALTDGDTMWDCAPLVEPLAVTAASSAGPRVTATIFYDDAVLAPESV